MEKLQRETVEEDASPASEKLGCNLGNTSSFAKALDTASARFERTRYLVW